MPEPSEASADELKRQQRAIKRGEREAEDDSLTPDEEDQHRRRADKAAYLEEKLAERERSERERG